MDAITAKTKFICKKNLKKKSVSVNLLGRRSKDFFDHAFKCTFYKLLLAIRQTDFLLLVRFTF